MEARLRGRGLKYFVPHELRHNQATLAGEGNFNEKYLQAAMRWDSPDMAKRYVHNTKKMTEKVADSVRDTLASAINIDVPKKKDPEKAPFNP